MTRSRALIAAMAAVIAFGSVDFAQAQASGTDPASTLTNSSHKRMRHKAEPGEKKKKKKKKAKKQLQKAMRKHRKNTASGGK